ncbi:Fc receptor-like protein 4 isoform X1 [Sarcophilus harrisii]|uniref:Ig-like domain-containing protein n=1 Tax=Sarcophilus harrisii TaxID=9305 RepID=G3WBA7_SARHA|nr:Fc receptor-like protein 4 isoform X1 [Sarcophilus harrisii]
MMLWTLLLILGLLNTQTAIAKKAIMHLSPPWTTVFSGENVTLTCHGINSFTPGTIWWYKNQQLQGIWSTVSIQTNQAGEYRCQTQDSALSDPVNLVVSSDLLILQTPYSVFEGDTLVLRCRGRDGTITNMTYYKDGRIFSYFLKHSDFSISRVGLSYSGKYHCTGVFTFIIVPWEKSSRKVDLQVQELFTPPKLKTITSEPTEGTPVTLSCETQLSPQRLDTKLHFSFFRDGRVITSGWKKSHVFQIPAIQIEDSGSYWCEAKAVTLNIRKQSSYLKISVKRIPISGILMEIQPTGGQVTEGEKLVLICSIAQGTGNITFSWHREGINASLEKKSQHSLEEKFVLSTVTENDSGRYYCTADNNISTISSLLSNVIVKSRNLSFPFNSSVKIDHLSFGLIVTQFIMIVLAASALLFFFGPWSKPGTPQRETLPVQFQTTSVK